MPLLSKTTTAYSGLKSLINFNAMNYCNKELKYYSYYKKNLQKSYFENNKNIFENTIKPSYHFSKEVLINLFIICVILLLF